MVAIEMQDTRVRQEQEVLSLTDSGGQASLMTLIKLFKGVNDVNFMGVKRRKLPWYQ